MIKIWAVPELNEKIDLTWQEAEALGIYVDDMITDAEIAE